MRIVLTGGGTGGHLVPFEPIIEGLRTLYAEQKQTLPKRLEPEQLTIIFMGVADTKTTEFFAHFDVRTIPIPSGKIRRYASALTIIDLCFRLPLGILLALWYGWRIMPDVIISKGGFGSIPMLLAAIVYRIPTLVHESDAVPGTATRFSARFATALAAGFTTTFTSYPKYHYKTFVTGTPVRERLSHIDTREAKRVFNFPPDELVLLIMGGSQGALAINEAVLQVLPELILDASIIHLTGESHFNIINTVAQELLASSSRASAYRVYPYLADTMIDALAAADVVVSRAGATTLAELTRLRKPALLIPLPGAANDHQRRNAQVYEQHGAARVLDPSNLGKNLFLRSLQELLTNQNIRQELAKNMATLDYPAAARDIAALAYRLASGFAPARPSN